MTFNHNSTYVYNRLWNTVSRFSHVQLFVIPWTIAHQALSVGFSRQEYWSGLPFPSPRDFPNPGIEHGSPALQADSLLPEPPGKPCLHRFTYSAVPYKLKHTIFILLHLLLSPSMFSRFIHMTACVTISLLFLTEYYFTV